MIFAPLSHNIGNRVQREHPKNSGGIGGRSSQKPAISLKRGKIGPRLLLMTNRKSHTRFRLVPKSMTLDGLEWPICILLNKRCVFRSPPQKMNEDRPILSATKMYAIESSFWRHKVCADIRKGSLERGRQATVG